MPTLPRVRLKDIAARANVSLMTVSLALRDRPGVCESTRHRVQALACTMGYVADPALSALAAYRTRQRRPSGYSTLALLTNWPQENGWIGCPCGRLLLEGARARAAQLGYHVEPFWLARPRMTARRASEILFNRGVRGVLVAPLAATCKGIDFAWDRFAVVTVEQPLVLPRFHYVAPDYSAGMQLVWAELNRRSYRRIGLVLTKENARRVRHRWDSAHAFEQRSTRSEADRVPTLYLESEADADAFHAWLDAHRPDVVAGKFDNLVHWLRASGRRLPQDIGYVSLNASDQQEQVSGIDQRRDVMGAQAVDAVHALLSRSHRGPDEVQAGTIIEGVWRDAGTLRAVSVG